MYYIKKLKVFFQSNSLQHIVATFISYIDSVIHREFTTLTPRSIRFEVTNACNFKCKPCPTTEKMMRQKQFMDFQLYCNIIDGNQQLRLVELFNWGEPLLHPKIIDFVSYASIRGIETLIVTNASLLTVDMSDKLLAAGLRKIYFSLDEMHQDSYKAARTDYSGIYDNIKYFISKARAMRTHIFVGINICVFSDNAEWLNNTQKDIAALPIDSMAINRGERYSKLAKPRTACAELYRSMVILVNGDVVPCCVDYEGDLRFSSVYDEIRLTKSHNNQNIRELRKKFRDPKQIPSLCMKCTFYR